MSAKRASASQGGSDRRKKKYRPDGTPVGGKIPTGPGVWVTCIKGKEKYAVSELYELFGGLASELWPEVKEKADEDSGAEDEELSIEAQIASEVSAMKRPKKEQRFTNCQTNTPCVVFISCKPPVDPVKLVTTHIHNVETTGITHTRHSLRFSPVSASCVTNIPEIQALCRTLFEPIFGDSVGKKFKYKIELRIRNHTTIGRVDLIEAIAKCVPEGHTVDLDDAELFILVEVFKSVCGVSVVSDYYNFNKFNVVEIANARASKTMNTSVQRIE